MINNTKPIFLTEEELFDAKYAHTLKLAVEMLDGSFVYILPPTKDRDFFGNINWSHKGAEMLQTMAEAAKIVDSYVGKDTWEEWSYA